MPRLLRIYLVGCIAIAFGYLALHVREPLRLNVGDPWSDAGVLASVAYIEQHGFTSEPAGGSPPLSDAYHSIQAPPLTALVYGALGSLGVNELWGMRLVALGFSALGVWLLFAYARRIWGDTVAVLATALFSTSLLWVMYADSIQRPPIMHAACFLALWGLVRAIESGQRRHYAALLLGSFACWFTSYDDYLFLPAGVLFTIYIKRGNWFARGNLRFVLICAAGCVAAVVAGAPFAGRLDPWQAAIDHQIVASLATLARRYTLLFTPMFWITLGYTVWRASRARSALAAVTDGATWALAAAMIFLVAFTPDLESPTLHAQPLLVFSALGSAIVIARMLESRPRRRVIAMVWAVAAPVWTLFVTANHPRAVLDRADVLEVNAYLAGNDRNDFVLSNLLSDGTIRTAFDRHSWPALESDVGGDARTARVEMLQVFDTAGTDYVHAVIFTTPESRFVDWTLGQLTMRRPLPSVTGWPELARSKTREVIRDYDARVHAHLVAVGAKQVLRLRSFDLYRIDRATVLELAGRDVPLVTAVDFSSARSSKLTLLGWGHPWLIEAQGVVVTSLDGHFACKGPVMGRASDGPAPNACETLVTDDGIRAVDMWPVNRAQLMVRVERACDLRLTLELAGPSLLAIAINGFMTSQCEPATRASFVIPQRSVRAGVNIVELEKKRFGGKDPRADVRSMTIEPLCAPEPPLP